MIAAQANDRFIPSPPRIAGAMAPNAVVPLAVPPGPARPVSRGAP